MKQKSRALRTISFLLLLFLGISTARAEETVAYTLTPDLNTSNTLYGNNYDVTINGIEWNAPGSQQYSPWRIGGNKLSSTSRVLYSKTAIANKITKIVITHGAKDNGISASSVTLSVHATAADAQSGTNAISSISKTYIDNGTMTFDCPEDKDWTGRFYRIDYSLKSSSSSSTTNYGIYFAGATFYSNTPATKHTITWSVNGKTDVIAPSQVNEGSPITFPTNVADIAGKKFVGWIEAASYADASVAPTFVTSATATADKTYYAVFATKPSEGFAVPTLITNTSGLVSGKSYYIAASADYASDVAVMAKRTGENYFLETTFDSEPLALTLGGSTDNWTFSYKDGSTTYYLDPTDATDNYLKRSTSVTKYGKFSISFSGNAAVITSKKGKNSNYTIQYRKGYFSCFENAQSPVYLYAVADASYSDYSTSVATSFSLAVGTSGFATLCLPFNAEVPEGLVAYVAQYDAEQAVATMTAVDDVLKAGEGYVVRATAGTYTFAYTSEAVAVENNALRGVLKPTAIKEVAGSSDNTAFILNYDAARIPQVQFNKSTSGTLGANKACLVIPTASLPTQSPIRIYWDDEQTAIDRLGDSDSKGESNAVYNLAGQRVSLGRSGRAALYIMNGKKVMY